MEQAEQIRLSIIKITNDDMKYTFSSLIEKLNEGIFNGHKDMGKTIACLYTKTITSLS